MLNPFADGFRCGFRQQTGTAVSVIVLAGVCSTPASAQEQSLDTPTYRFLSGPGTAALLGGGVLRGIFARDRHKGRIESMKTADALVTSVVVSELFKQTIHERRPDRSASDSFPSGHTTAVFAVATMQSHYHPNEAPLWFAGATVIGDSRIRLHKHYFHDVLAGGILGVLTAEIELHQPRGLLIAPIFRPDSGERGVALSARF